MFHSRITTPKRAKTLKTLISAKFVGNFSQTEGNDLEQSGYKRVVHGICFALERRLISQRCHVRSRKREKLNVNQGAVAESKNNQ